jgi:acetolactate synthase-1/2/3 large subunit
MTTGAQSLVRTLRAEGVDTVFTLTGGHILPILDACVVEGVRVIDVRHEQAAAHAADAHARLTGRLGVAAVTAGPGATGTVTAIATAFNAASPVLLLVGGHPSHEDLRGGLQEMDHPPLFDGIARWTHTARDPARLSEIASIAVRRAFANRGGPVVIDIPWDVQAAAAPAPAPIDGARRPNRPSAVDPDTIVEVADLLAGATRPVVFAGTGLRWAEEAPLDDLATIGRLPLFLNSLARGAVRWDHPNLGNRARSWALGRPGPRRCGADQGRVEPTCGHRGCRRSGCVRVAVARRGRQVRAHLGSGLAARSACRRSAAAG